MHITQRCVFCPLPESHHIFGPQRASQSSFKPSDLDSLLKPISGTDLHLLQLTFYQYVA